MIVVQKAYKTATKFDLFPTIQSSQLLLVNVSLNTATKIGSYRH